MLYVIPATRTIARCLTAAAFSPGSGSRQDLSAYRTRSARECNSNFSMMRTRWAVIVASKPAWSATGTARLAFLRPFAGKRVVKPGEAPEGNGRPASRLNREAPWNYSWDQVSIPK